MDRGQRVDPGRFTVRHRCGQTTCVTVEHLTLTRNGPTERRRPGDPMADAQVAELRARYAAGGVSQRQLAHNSASHRWPSTAPSTLSPTAQSPDRSRSTTVATAAAAPSPRRCRRSMRRPDAPPSIASTRSPMTSPTSRAIEPATAIPHCGAPVPPMAVITPRGARQASSNDHVPPAPAVGPWVPPCGMRPLEWWGSGVDSAAPVVPPGR